LLRFTQRNDKLKFIGQKEPSKRVVSFSELANRAF
jgi:hypothetical protein